MNKSTIVFLGAKEIGTYCLQYLLDNAGDLSIEILAVVGRKNKALDGEISVVDLAEQHNIELFSTVNDIPQADYIISVQHNEILKERHIAQANKLAVNLHMAPLPEYRGCNQFSFAIIDNAEEFGTTLHVLDTGIDSGDILFERRFPLAKDSWVEDLFQKTLAESKLLFSEHIGQLFSESYTRTPQKDLEASRGTSYHFRNEINEAKIIDENWSLEKKKRHIRATFKEGFEPPYSIIEGKKKYYSKDTI